jgi:hypothetical protein
MRLVWRNPDGNLGGPLAEQVADLLQEGYFVRKLTGEIGIHVPGLKNFASPLHEYSLR